MTEIVEIIEKLNSTGEVGKDTIDIILNIDILKNNPEIMLIVNTLKKYNTITIINKTKNEFDVSTLKQIALKEEIRVVDDGFLRICLTHRCEVIDNSEYDLILIDGLEDEIEKSSRLEQLDVYLSHFLDKADLSKKSIPISLKLMNSEEDSYWIDKFDKLGSDNPDRDIAIYSNKREFINKLSLEFEKKREYLFNSLRSLLDAIVRAKVSSEEIEKIKQRYRNNNNHKEIFLNKKMALIAIAEHLADNMRNETIVKSMNSIVHRLNTEEFSIGVTGIIKAGKSTMLNALLSKEILGTAIRPETANLTIIKKSHESKALVHFWSKEEWESIKNEANDQHSKVFVSDSEKLSGFQDYIQDEPKSIEISIEELENYTSARKSEGLCNLVKDVELFLPLDFLDGGVSIVDTPGIDDPIIQREVITLKYLESCSAILHLMNAKQSATQKDIEFIGDALIEQGISSLLVVITRIDTLGSNKEEIDKKLAEIISHARESIENYLSKRSDKDISSIIAKLEFMPLAGKFALMHRVGNGQKAIEKGFYLKDTGILEIENYLNTMLFGGRNEKARLLLTNSYRSIEQAIISYHTELTDNLRTVDLGVEELEEMIDHIKSEKKDIYSQLSRIEDEIKSEQKRIIINLKSLKSNFENKFDIFRRDLIDKISSNVIKQLINGEKPDENELKDFISRKLKEFVSNIQQWYVDQSLIILEESIDYIDSQYTNLKLPQDATIQLQIDKLEILSDFSYSAIMFGLGGGLGFAGAFLFGPVGWVGAALLTWWAGDYIDKKRDDEITKQVNKKMNELDKELKKMNKKIHDDMINELEKYDNELINYFIENTMGPAKTLKSQYNEKESLLNNLIKDKASKEKMNEELKKDFTFQLEILEQSLNELKGV